MTEINKVIVFPWAEDSTNPYQKLMKGGFESIGVEVYSPKYNNLFPLYNCLKDSKDADAVFLDWVHPFYTSPGYWNTLLKTILGELERFRIKNRKTPVIWNLHNLHRHDKLHQNLEQWSFRRLARVVDGIRVFNEVSKKAAQKYLDLDESVNIRVIPHGNYIDTFRHLPVSKNENTLEFDTSDHVLIIFGGIREGKGIIKFINCFSRIKDESFKLLIVGQAQTTNIDLQLRTLADNDHRISLVLKRVSDQELFHFFSLADYAVLPYEYILNSGAAITAMSCGVPIIASDIPVFREVLNESFAYIGDLHQEATLKHIFEKIKTNKRHLEMKKEALITAESLAWNDIAQSLIDFAIDIR